MRQATLKKEPEEMRRLINKLYTRIHKVKIPKLELNEPIKEYQDPQIIIDDTPTITGTSLGLYPEEPKKD